MRKTFPNIAVALLFVCAHAGLTFAAQKFDKLPWEEEKQTVMQGEAQNYRTQGLEAQRIGNIDGAISFYKKAIERLSLYKNCFFL